MALRFARNWPAFASSFPSRAKTCRFVLIHSTNTRRNMIRRISFVLAALLLCGSAANATGPGGRQYIRMYGDYNGAARWFNANIPWHGAYAHGYWRQPVALMAPPVANMQTTYSWGVGRTRMVPNYHQFTRPYVAPGGGGGASIPAPNWPSSTTQQGVSLRARTLVAEADGHVSPLSARNVIFPLDAEAVWYPQNQAAFLLFRPVCLLNQQVAAPPSDP